MRLKCLAAASNATRLLSGGIGWIFMGARKPLRRFIYDAVITIVCAGDQQPVKIHHHDHEHWDRLQLRCSWSETDAPASPDASLTPWVSCKKLLPGAHQAVSPPTTFLAGNRCSGITRCVSLTPWVSCKKLLLGGPLCANPTAKFLTGNRCPASPPFRAGRMPKRSDYPADRTAPLT